MKNIFILISAMFGLMLASGVAMADQCVYNHTVTIEKPVADSTTNSTILFLAKTPEREGVDCTYTLDNSAISNITYRTEHGTKHNATISGLTPGKHKIEVYCVRKTKTPQCTYEAKDDVEWYVGTTAIPEYPTAMLPAILSVLSLGLVKMKK